MQARHIVKTKVNPVSKIITLETTEVVIKIGLVPTLAATHQGNEAESERKNPAT